MKDNKEIEQILLNDENYEKFVSKKLEKEFTSIIPDSKAEKVTEITDFSKVPKDKLFDKSTIYTIINKQSKTKSFINGIQAEGFLGSQEIVRKKFLDGTVDFFVCDDNYIKFYKYKNV